MCDIPDYGRSNERNYDDRVTLREKNDFLDRVDELVEEDVYDNRSEAIRRLARLGIEKLDDSDNV